MGLSTYLFNLYKSLKNYTEYIEKLSIDKDDRYILPIVNRIFPELQNITFIVFENVNLDTRIKMQLDQFQTINDSFVFIYLQVYFFIRIY